MLLVKEPKGSFFLTMNKREKLVESLIKINAALNSGAQKHYEDIGLQYVDVPEIVGITGACENVDTLFKVGNRLDLPLFFTQTGQLALEQALQFFQGVYTVIHSGRDEEFEDERHIRQFRLTEEEFDCTMAGMQPKNYDEEKMFSSLLEHIELAIKAITKSVIDNCKHELQRDHKQDVGWLKELVSMPFLRIPYDESVVLLKWNGFPDIKFGDDLEAGHEQKVIQIVNQKLNGNGEAKGRLLPVFITRYPQEIKFFNMKVSERDPRVVLSADLILPISGEAVGSAVREHDGKKLKSRLLESVMFRLHKERGGTYEDFVWYVDDLVAAGKTRPHAGYGIGNERVVQFLLGKRDIRDCSLFSLLAEQTKDWDKAKRGTMHFLSLDKKMVLLSIGRRANKKKLLPAIKKIKDNGLVFYATQNTHKYLNENGVSTTLVHKISQKKKKPNVADLLKEDFFDIIINIPTRDNNSDGEITDGRMIRRAALRTKTALITDVEVAEDLLSELLKVKAQTT